MTQHFFSLLGPQEAGVDVATSDFVPSVGDPRKRRGNVFHSQRHSAHLWVLEKVGAMWQLLLLSTLLGTLENAGVTLQFRPLVGPRDGKGDALTSYFVPSPEDPQERIGGVAIPPTCGPLRG